MSTNIPSENSMTFRDYYEILDVQKSATQDEIRKAFRKLARKYHPDVAEEKSTAEEKFKEINEAYEVLGDPEKRKKYNTLGPNWQSGGQTPPPGYESSNGGDYDYQFTGTGFSDFFEQMFGAGARPGPSSFQSGPQVRGGQDAHADILVSLEEALKGTERILQLQQVNRATGQRELKKSTIRIPKGITEGQLIRCAGLGNPGLNGGPPGDLFLHVRLEKHPDFRVVGSDLYYDLALTPWEAVLGTEVPVRTLAGEIRIKIPPHTDHGTEFRLKDRGLPGGHLYALVKIAIPQTVTAKEKTQWEALATSSTHNPRKP